MRGSYWKLLVWKWVFQTACIPFWCSSEHHLPCALGCQCKPTFKNFADVEIYCTLLLTRPFILLKEETEQSEYLLCFRNPCQWFSIPSSRYFHFLSISVPFVFLLLLTSKTFSYNPLCYIVSPHILAFIDISWLSVFVWFILHHFNLLKNSQCSHNGLLLWNNLVYKITFNYFYQYFFVLQIISENEFTYHLPVCWDLFYWRLLPY